MEYQLYALMDIKRRRSTYANPHTRTLLITRSFILPRHTVGNHLRYAISIRDCASILKTAAEYSSPLHFGANHGLFAQR